jgi:hypothetical protein
MSETEVRLPDGGAAEALPEAAPVKGTPGRKLIGTRPLTGNERVERYRARQKKKKLAAVYKFDSDLEPTKTEAKKILEARIENAHTLDTVYDLLIRAAEQLGISANAFLFQNGIMATLQSIEQKKKSFEEKKPQLIAEIPDEPVVSELLNRSELYAIWDSSVSWCEDISFDEFLRLRRVCKTDAYELGLLLGKDFDTCHKVWSEFFPRFKPDTLVPAYTQKQMREWVDQNTLTKDFLLMASRNSLKSSFILVWALTLVLCCPDVRILLVSETQKLSRGFIRSFRSYWEFEPKQRTKLQLLFPEYCIPKSEGSVLSFESPLAHLNLIQSTAECTSLESTVAGNRSDCIIFDDPISNLSTGNDEQIQSSIDRWDLLCKLREVGSPVITIGTPWAPTDLYATLLKRNEADENKPLAFRIDPAFIVKSEARYKELLDLREEDIESFLLPARLNWKFLRKEMVANPTFFKSQNLCQFVPSEEDLLKVTFTEEELRARVKPLSAFNTAMTISTVICLDSSNFSTSRFADFCCMTTAKIMKQDGKDIVVVTDMKLERWRMSECAAAVVTAIQAANPNHILIEKTGAYEQLAIEIRKEAARRGFSLPFIYWKSGNLGNVKYAKTRRIKSLEPMIAESRFFFTPFPCLDAALAQFVRFDGVTKSSSSRFDDAPDCCALLVEAYYPKQIGDPEKTPHQREVEEAAMKAARDDARLRQMHNRIFGSESILRRPEPVEPEVERNPFLRVAGGALKRRS